MFDDTPKSHVYQALTPDVVLDALSDLGLEVDGRLTGLSSYENRVYQVMLDDNSSVVAKFYRPERWTDAQILEEHSFAAELMAEEVPLVGPLVMLDQTLHHANGFAFSVSPRRGGRMPELDDAEVLEWIGRFIARIHNVGAKQEFASRPTLNVQTFAIESRDWLIAHDTIPLDQQNARPHPRNFGTFPRVLGRYVRERGVLELTDAVRKMTSEPARRLGITNRGQIAVGMAADIVIFDPVVVADCADFGKKPEQPEGINYVIVNGNIVLNQGVITEQRPGLVLRHN